MMLVQTTCQTCGIVQVDPRSMVVSECLNASHLNSYTFRCPVCAQWCIKTADTQAFCLLIGAGVTLVRWSLPEAEVHDGPELTVWDLQEFAEQLAATDLLAEEAAA